MSIMLDEPSHILKKTYMLSDCDCDFRFKKSIIDDQIAEMAPLNFTALELSLFSRTNKGQKKLKHFTTASEIKSYQEHLQKN